MKPSVAITLILVGAAMILGPLVFSYLYHGEPPIHSGSGIGYSWACFLAGCASMAIGIVASLNSGATHVRQTE
jgi:hypothetical protein